MDAQLPLFSPGPGIAHYPTYSSSRRDSSGTTHSLASTKPVLRARDPRAGWVVYRGSHDETFLLLLLGPYTLSRFLANRYSVSPRSEIARCAMRSRLSLLLEIGAVKRGSRAKFLPREYHLYIHRFIREKRAGKLLSPRFDTFLLLPKTAATKICIWAKAIYGRRNHNVRLSSLRKRLARLTTKSARRAFELIETVFGTSRRKVRRGHANNREWKGFESANWLTADAFNGDEKEDGTREVFQDDLKELSLRDRTFICFSQSILTHVD